MKLEQLLDDDTYNFCCYLMRNYNKPVQRSIVRACIMYKDIGIKRTVRFWQDARPELNVWKVNTQQIRTALENGDLWRDVMLEILTERKVA